MGKLSLVNLKKAYNFLRENGLSATAYEVRTRLAQRNDDYKLRRPDKSELEKQRAASGGFSYRPIISAVIPLYNSDENMLGQLFECLKNQSYDNWEVIFADGSDSVKLGHFLKELCEREDIEQPVRYFHIGENRGISENTNYGLERAYGDYIALIDHDDLIEPDAFFEVVSALNKYADGERPGIIYTDEDKTDESGENYFDPVFKPDFDMFYLLCNNYICHMSVFEAGLIKSLKLRKKFDGAQDHDLLLRAAVKTGNKHHIPKILYHWRVFGNSTSGNTRGKFYAYEAGRRAVSEAAVKHGIKAEVYHTRHVGVFGFDFAEDPLIKAGDREDASGTKALFERVGAIGGVVIRRNKNGKIIGGPLLYSGYAEDVTEGSADEKGARKRHGLYSLTGLPSPAGGRYNRRFVMQEALYLDIRCIKIAPDLIPLFEETIGYPYNEKRAELRTELAAGRSPSAPDTIFDWRVLPQDTDYEKIGLRLCSAIAEKGYKLVFVPDLAEIP